MTGTRGARREALEAFKRQAILEAARTVFLDKGVEGASVRAIAEEAGYVAGTLYRYFDSIEAIYAELLDESLIRLFQLTQERRQQGQGAAAVVGAFYDYYRENPEDLELGLYLDRGHRRKGLNRALDQRLNKRLLDSMQAMAESVVEDTGADEGEAQALVFDLTAHMVGALILEAAGRTRLLQMDPAAMIAARLAQVLPRR